METLEKTPDIRILHSRIAELEAALADACQDLLLTRAWVRLACGQEGILPQETVPSARADGRREPRQVVARD